MFGGASDFNQDISSWDVSSGENFMVMFAGDLENVPSSSFNQDISSWDVSSGINFVGMFAGNKKFDQDLRNWDFSSIDNFDGTFEGRPLTFINDTQTVSGIDFIFYEATKMLKNGWSETPIVDDEFKMVNSFISKIRYLSWRIFIRWLVTIYQYKIFNTTTWTYLLTFR